MRDERVTADGTADPPTPPRTEVDWIQTYTHRKFHPLAPDPRELDIEDIAQSLSLQCRFNGHCRTFYSVADHSVRVSAVVPPEHALWGLLHDAAEAYLSDLPRPIKVQIPTYREYEDRLMRVIADHFGLGWPMPEAVHVADNRLLATEQRDLMGPPPDSWGLTVAPYDARIEPLSPAAARAAFLARYAELTRG